jgi:hypothetical protein
MKKRKRDSAQQKLKKRKRDSAQNKLKKNTSCRCFEKVADVLKKLQLFRKSSRCFKTSRENSKK